MLENYGVVLTVNDVSQILNLGLSSVYELLRNGELEGFKKGKWLVPQASIERFLTRNAYGKKINRNDKKEEYEKYQQ